jgi:hypothetical protein
MVTVGTSIRFEHHKRGPSQVTFDRHGATSWRVTWGQIGGEKYSRLDACESEARADQIFTAQIRTLERWGYQAGHHDPAQMALLRAHRNDLAHYQAYAAWLAVHQDARGALMHAMLDGDTQERERLLHLHPVQLSPIWWGQHKISAIWRYGFIEELLFASCVDPTPLRRVLRHPSCALLRTLHIDNAASVAREYQRRRAMELYQTALESLPGSLSRVVLKDAPHLTGLPIVGLEIG